jgi:hypothetical protein
MKGTSGIKVPLSTCSANVCLHFCNSFLTRFNQFFARQNSHNAIYSVEIYCMKLILSLNDTLHS